MTVTILGQQGEMDEAGIAALAKRYGGKHLGSGTMLESGERDIEYEFPTGKGSVFAKQVKALSGVGKVCWGGMP